MTNSKHCILLFGLLTVTAGAPALGETAPKARRITQLPEPIRQVNRTLPPKPTESDLRSFMALPEPLVPTSKLNDPGVRQQLAAALLTWSQSANFDDLSALRRFVAKNPQSRWSPSLRLNLGLLAYRNAQFSDALEDWRAVWENNKTSESYEGQTIANAGLAHYCKMLARLGRKQELSELLETTKHRVIQGAAHEHYTAAREGFATMERRPNVSFRCGSFALASVAEKLAGASSVLLREADSPLDGFSVAELLGLASKAGMKMAAIRRQRGAEIPVPSVVHWKLNHYAAVLEQRGDFYLLKDPTFDSQHWVRKRVLDDEASGAFLVVQRDQSSLPDGWTVLNDAERASTRGKGYTTCTATDGAVSGDESTAVSDMSTASCQEEDPPGGGVCTPTTAGMPSYALRKVPCSLLIQDTPISFTSAYGPSMPFRISYYQRTINQPNTMLFGNFGPNFSSEFTAHVDVRRHQFDTEAAWTEILVHLRNGGYEQRGEIGPSQWARQQYNTSFNYLSAGPGGGCGGYERRFRDGSKEVYGLRVSEYGDCANFDPSSAKVFLTQIVDKAGHALSLVYDTDPAYPTRLKYVVDAAGLATELSYEDASDPYLITRVRDPLNREARFFYADLAGRRRLARIRDAAGMESSFSYTPEGLIDSMTTPYGRTSFAFGRLGNSAPDLRFIEVTGPSDLKERVELRSEDTFYGTPPSEPILPSAPSLNIQNNFYHFRNVFHWDNKAMSVLGGSVTADPAASLGNATIYHYLHAENRMSGVLESVKQPLQSRVYYNYPGQELPYERGTSNKWSVKARLVEDGNGGLATEVTRREFNSLGQITKVVDPVGRETVYEYDTDGIDLRFTKQKTGTGSQTIQEIQYNPSFPPHLPWKIIDAAGQPTTHAYNSRRQLTSVTNALNETTTYAYEESVSAPDYGKLKEITGALPGAITAFTYDAVQRLRTITDSAGYTLTYDYDNLDRQTRVTYPDGTYEEIGYDRLDVGTRRDRMGRVTQTKYNATREPVMTIDPAERVLQFEYCSCGSMETLVDGNGNRTTWDFDVQGRQISKRYADGKGDDFSYEPVSGRLSTITDAKGQIKKFTYNLDGTLRKLDYQNEQVATPDVNYTYDPSFNRLATMIDGIGTHTYEYYPLGVLGALQVHTLDGPFTDPVPLTDLITYTYDALGRVKTRNIGPSGAENKITSGYDALGRTTSEINNLCPTNTQFTHNYVGATHRLESIDYPNGQRTLFDYWPSTTPAQPGNGDFRLKQIANFGQGIDSATLLSRFEYTYDPTGNILTWGRRLGAAAVEETYILGYDEVDQLTRAVLSETENPTNSLYRYYAEFDKFGNRLSEQQGDILTGYSFNLLNELTATGGSGIMVVAGHTDEPARVDINGVAARLLPGNFYEANVPVASGINQLAVTATDFALTNNQQTKSWNVDVGHAVEGSQNFDLNGNTLSSAGETYEWDSENRLISKTKDGVRRAFLYDGFNRRAAEVSAAGGIVQRWVWCDFFPCERRNSAGNEQQFVFGAVSGSSRQFYSFDHLGSLREVSSSSGTLLQRWDYTLTGRRTRLDESGGFDPQIAFAGLEPFDDKLAATFRIYDPEIARWISRDPVQEVGGLNLYAYVNNRVTSATDTLGLAGEACCSNETALRNLRIRSSLLLQLSAAQLQAGELSQQLIALDVEGLQMIPIEILKNGNSAIKWSQCIAYPETCVPGSDLMELNERSNALRARLRRAWDTVHFLQSLIGKVGDCSPIQGERSPISLP